MPKPRKSRPYPNNETQWSYFMQAIEPDSGAINAAFPEYHPMWVIQSQKMLISGGQFEYLRETMLRMTTDQCAAYLRVDRSTIQRWEAGKIKVPFSAFELLRLVFESAHFRLSHKNWQGWFIDQAGRLVSPDRGDLSFTPHELSFVRETHQFKTMYEMENSLLRAEIEPLRAEIAELRAAGDSDGLLGELKAIEVKLADLASRVSSNKVVRIDKKSKKANYSLEAKVA